MTLIRLPAYRLSLVSEHSVGRDGARVYHGSAWRPDPDSLLGGERSVFTYWHAVCGRPKPQAADWTRRYFAMRAAVGWPVTAERAPANLHHDFKQLAGVFDRLAHASWCTACHAAPALPRHWLCAWCRVAPIAPLYPAPPSRAWIDESEGVA